MAKEEQSSMNDLEKRQQYFVSQSHIRCDCRSCDCGNKLLEEPDHFKAYRAKDIWEWLKEGYAAGFISDVYCQNHQHSTVEDEAEFGELYEEADGLDFCWSVVNIKWGHDGDS